MLSIRGTVPVLSIRGTVPVLSIRDNRSAPLRSDCVPLFGRAASIVSSDSILSINSSHDQSMKFRAYHYE